MNTAEYVSCDTLLLSVGLIPENELTEQAKIEIDPKTGGPYVDNFMETSLEGVFACGNVVHVNDLVDNVSEESSLAGSSSAGYILGKDQAAREYVNVIPGKNVRYTVPQRIRKGSFKNLKIMFRSVKIINDGVIRVKNEKDEIFSKKKEKIIPGEIETVRLSADFSEDITVKVKKK